MDQQEFTFSRRVFAIGALTTAVTACASAAQTAPRAPQFDVEYVAGGGVRQSLDLHYPTSPIKGAILFAHGGSWQRGAKEVARGKAAFFTALGYVFATTNYRFRPTVSLDTMAEDVARAAVFTFAAANRASGSARTPLFLIGHSAGAHLVSLVGVDAGFMERAGGDLRDVTGVVSLDTGPYDAALQMATTNLSTQYGQMLNMVFGTDPAILNAVSPIRHITARTPPFLVVSSDNRADVPRQAMPFAAALEEKGRGGVYFNGVGRTHESLMGRFATPDDPTTQRTLAFMAEQITRR